MPPGPRGQHRRIYALPVEISIVIPAYNEADRIQEGFDRLRPVLEQLGPDRVEVIVVDDGSSDATGPVAAVTYGALPHSLVVNQEINRGKGAAFRLGVSVARGASLVVCDADMAINPAHLPEVLDALTTSPLAFGSRAIDRPIRYDSMVRTQAGALFNHLVRRKIDTDSRDTQCGFKGFTLPAARLLAAIGLVEGFAYDVELYFLAAQLGLAVTPVPVRWDDVKGSSVHVSRDARTMWRDITSIPRTNYSTPVVRVPSAVTIDEVDAVARSSRLQGIALARGDSDSLVVVPRSGALAAIEIAKVLGGSVGTAQLADVRGRELIAL